MNGIRLPYPPVNGDFLFQVHLNIGGKCLKHCFHPRRWGFFISGLSLQTLFYASSLYYTAILCCLYQPCEPFPQKRQTQDFRIAFRSNRSDKCSRQRSSSLSGSCHTSLRTVIASQLISDRILLRRSATCCATSI